MRKALRILFSPIYRFMTKPGIRFGYLPIINQLFAYSRKEEIMEQCLNFVNFSGLDGDYLEFGTWKGGSLIAVYNLSKRFKNLSKMKFYAFDSFRGLPPKKGVDSNFQEFKEGDYASSLEEVKKNLKKGSVDLNRVTFIEGWYQDTLNEKTRKSLPIKTAAIIYVDCDLYESARLVLDFITPYVADGTVLIFDDWHVFRNRSDAGEQKALDQWLKQNPKFVASRYRPFGWPGEVFIVNKVK